MIKKILITLFFIFITGIYLLQYTAKSHTNKPLVYRDNFTNEEQKIMQVARQIVDSAYYGTLITIDGNGQPKARIMEPFHPDKHFEIYLATNPHSRKVSEIKNNNMASLHYFDKRNLGYVSFYGKAFIVTDDSLKKTLWKPGWERFYKNRDNDYMLIKFMPRYLEVISIASGLTGDPQTWAPSRVNLVLQKD